MWERKGQALEPDFEDPEFLRCATVAITMTRVEGYLIQESNIRANDYIYF